MISHRNGLIPSILVALPLVLLSPAAFAGSDRTQPAASAYRIAPVAIDTSPSTGGHSGVFSDLRSPNEDVRARAVARLGNDRTMADQSLRALAASLGDKSPKVRGVALDILISFLGSPDETNRFRIINSLRVQPIRTLEAATVLALGTGDESLRIRRTASDVLIDFLRSRDRDVRLRAMEAFRAYPARTDYGVKVLAFGLGSGTDSVRRLAREHIDQVLRSPDEGLRLAALDQVRRYKFSSHEAVGVLSDAMRNSSHSVRESAALGLAELRKPEAGVALKQAAKDGIIEAEAALALRNNPANRPAVSHEVVPREGGFIGY